jgi:hypothetical protein
MKTVSKVSRTKGSIIPSFVNKIIIGKELKSSEKTGLAAHLSEAVINDNQNGYVVEFIWWGYDDAGDDYFAFDNLKSATDCYNYFLKPLSEQILEDEKGRGKLAIIKRGDVKKYIPGMEYYGYFVQSFYGGDLLKPFFDSTAAPELNEELKLFLTGETDIREIIGTKFEKCLIKMGENTGGLSCYFEGESPIIQDNVVHATTHYCWETGLNYEQLITRLPENVFKAIRPYIQYHAEEIEEEGDWKGWFITDKDELKRVLASYNFILNED